MKYLLDTHVVIWHFNASPKLPQKIAEIIENTENTLYFSSASLWEIAIKMNAGKLRMNMSLDELLFAVTDSDVHLLQIENAYLQKLSTLPSLHKDPFDRLLISTALAEGCTIITADESIQKYDAPWLW